MKIDRLIGILSILLQEEKTTAPELAESANFASPVCVFRLNRCEYIASPVYGYGSSV